MIPAKKTVKRQIFIRSITLSIVLLLVLGGFFTKSLYKSELSKAKGQIKQRNLAINLFVEAYFSEIKNTVKVIADNKDVQNAPILNTRSQEKVLDLYRSIARHNKNIAYIYTGYDTGLLLIDGWVPQEDYNPVVRPWYQSALAAKPNVSIGLPYQDFNNKEWLISTSASFKGEHSEIQGVVAIDVSIQKIADLLKQKSSDYKTLYSYVLNEQQDIIIHHNEIYLNKILTDLIKKPVKTDQNHREFTYTVDTASKIKKDAYYSTIPSTGWVVVTVVEKSEIVKPVVRQLLLSLILPLLLAFSFALTLSNHLSRRFSSPLIELKSRVKTIISGDNKADYTYQYPDNEIGIIAKEIGRLTEQELYKKAKDLKDINTSLGKIIEELHTLRGIIPICSSCKKIRDDKGSWNQLESYIQKHSEAEFSHSMCPECSDKVYGKEDWYIKMKEDESKK